MTSQRKGAFAYDEVREARRREEAAERLRLYYVAMTRAVDRLLVSGAIDPASTADASTPIGWVLGRLDCAEELGASVEAPVELVRGDARLLLRADRFRPVPDAPAAEPGREEQLSLFAEGGAAEPLPPAPILPALESIPAPPLHRLRRLSFTGLSTFEQCSYKYYARYVAGMRERRPSAVGGAGMAATDLGSAVHALLERHDADLPPDVSTEDAERISGLVQAWHGSALGARVAALENVEREAHFTFEHEGVLVHGYIDLLHRRDGRALVVDYKTNALGELSPAEVVEHEYRLQRLVYALACFRDGADEVEVVYAFLERPEVPVAATFRREDVPRLEAELTAAIDAIHAGEFRPRPSDFACSTCPALDLVCAGPRLRDGGPGVLALAAVRGG